jgi:hypothetical protein
MLWGRARGGVAADPDRECPSTLSPVQGELGCGSTTLLHSAETVS